MTWDVANPPDGSKPKLRSVVNSFRNLCARRANCLRIIRLFRRSVLRDSSLPASRVFPFVSSTPAGKMRDPRSTSACGVPSRSRAIAAHPRLLEPISNPKRHCACAFPFVPFKRLTAHEDPVYTTGSVVERRLSVTHSNVDFRRRTALRLGLVPIASTKMRLHSL